jgi:hypothetical protein
MDTKKEYCRNHSDRKAVGSCAGCGAPICQQCVSEQRSGRFLCFDCALDISLDDFSELSKKQRELGNQRRSEVARFQKKKEKKKEKRAFRIFLIVCFVIIAFESGVLLIDYYLQQKEESSFISSHEMELRYNRDVSMNDLHLIGTTIESYQSRNNGALPKDLSMLVPDYIEDIPTDPITGSDYIYGIEDGEYRVESPHPESYGLRYLVNIDGSIYHEEIR